MWLRISNLSLCESRQSSINQHLHCHHQDRRRRQYHLQSGRCGYDTSTSADPGSDQGRTLHSPIHLQKLWRSVLNCPRTETSDRILHQVDVRQLGICFSKGPDGSTCRLWRSLLSRRPRCLNYPPSGADHRKRMTLSLSTQSTYMVGDSLFAVFLMKITSPWIRECCM